MKKKIKIVILYIFIAFIEYKSKEYLKVKNIFDETKKDNILIEDNEQLEKYLSQYNMAKEQLNKKTDEVLYDIVLKD